MLTQSLGPPFHLLSLILTLLVPLGICRGEEKSLVRTADPLEVSGDSLPGIIGAPLERIRVSALRDRSWSRVSSQIDERRRVRRESGEVFLDYVLQEGIQSQEDDDPAFDGDDLLVFLSRDLGDRAGSEDMVPSDGPVYEIEATDPRDGSSGWVYVSVAPKDLSAPGEDYVSYRPDESILEGSRYRIHLSRENPLLYEQLVLKGGVPKTGATERSIVDRFKMRAKASVVLPFFRFRRNEEDLRSRTVAWTDGPVRVIRRTETWVDLLWGFTTQAQVQDTIFYPDHFYFAVDLTSPVALDRLIARAEVRLSADLNEQAVGMLFVSRGNTSGLMIDGVMSEQERSMETEGQYWYAVGDADATLYSRLIIPQDAPVQASLVYMDDRGEVDPPEEHPGRWGDAGYRISGLESVGKGSYQLLLHSMVGEGYRAGHERAFLDITDRPLSWNCRPLRDVDL
jgi:hypothetical protein